jgi:hypothetical protein
MGNRGCIHRDRAIVRQWATKRWITCALEFKGWVAPKWVPGRWTALFFYDEALSFAAGHRPCALCRRSDYTRFLATAEMDDADSLDAQLHAERVEGRRKRLHRLEWRDLPVGTFVEIEGAPHVVRSDCVQPWFPQSGYGPALPRPRSGTAVVITPPRAIYAMRHGYVPHVAPSP